MSSCATVPTETQFQVLTTTSASLSTSFSTAVTTLAPAVVTSTTTVCSGNSSNSACSTGTVLVTGPASTSTISVPVTITVPVTFTTSNPTRTLFSTSCNSGPTSSSSSSSASTSQTPQSTPAPPSSTPASTSLISSSSITTLSDGNVVTTQVVVTSTLPPSSTVLSSEPSPSLNHSSGGGSSSKIAPIVGGVVGGVIALAVIGSIWYIWRRSKRWRDIFDEQQDAEKQRPRMSIDGDVQPRPYHYGLVGHSTSPTPPSSPPGSPPLGAVNQGHSPANSLSLLNAPPQHSRSSSGIELSPGVISRSLSDLGSASATGHVRPNLSTASSGAASTRPLLERPVNHSRNPSAWSFDAPNNLAAARSQPILPSSRPHSAGGTLQNATTSATLAESVPRPQTSPVAEKRRLLASLPPGAAAPAPPSSSINSGSSASLAPATESHPPPIRKRNPNRPSSAKGQDAVTVHTDAGPATEPDQRPPHPEGNEPPAYSPT